MSWLGKLLPSRIRRIGESRQNMPEGLWLKCPSCEAVLYKSDLEHNASVCPQCGHHHELTARQRLDLFLDPAGREEIGQEVQPVDTLKFKDSKRYTDRLKAAAKATGETDALRVTRGTLRGLPVVAACFEYSFMGGSMGSVVGERLVRGIERAIADRAAFVCFSASGGARMQEGLLSLMQMAKVNSSLTRLAQAGLPYVSVLLNPTMGGVSASFAFVGDVVIAEPRALIGFAGPRVIENTVREVLPEGFQRAEFLLEKGAIDMICDRRQLRDRVAGLIGVMLQQLETPVGAQVEPVVTPAVDRVS